MDSYDISPWDIPIEEVKQEFKTVKERVKFILNKHPEARNNYLYLVVLYWRYFEPFISKYFRYIPLDVLVNATSIETITRAARKLWEEGECPPPDLSVRDRRVKRKLAFRKILKQSNNQL